MSNLLWQIHFLSLMSMSELHIIIKTLFLHSFSLHEAQLGHILTAILQTKRHLASGLFPSSHPQAASPWSIRSKASAEAFATFPPSATHFPLGRKCSPRRPGRCLSRSRQKFSLARNKTAFAAWGPRAPSTAKDSTILPCS